MYINIIVSWRISKQKNKIVHLNRFPELEECSNCYTIIVLNSDCVLRFYSKLSTLQLKSSKYKYSYINILYNYIPTCTLEEKRHLRPTWLFFHDSYYY